MWCSTSACTHILSIDCGLPLFGNPARNVRILGIAALADELLSLGLVVDEPTCSRKQSELLMPPYATLMVDVADCHDTI